MYLTYKEYMGMGGSIEENAFARLEAKARAHLDRLTFGRLVNSEILPDTVKFCMYDLVTAMESDERTFGTAGREIASMSNDGLSVTFATGSGSSGSVSARYGQIVRAWLSCETTAYGLPLLYAGVDA